MKLLFMLGDQAVGKMTVGQELAKITSLRLFHNHMTIEPVWQLFGYKHWKTIERLRTVFFQEFAASEHYGMIYTKAMAFNAPNAWDSIAHITDIFKQYNAEIYYAELFAPLEIRLQRNTTENRITHKPSKKFDYEESVESMLDKNARRYSLDGEVPFKNYIKIDNTNIPPADAANMIKQRFLLDFLHN